MDVKQRPAGQLAKSVIGIKMSRLEEKRGWIALALKACLLPASMVGLVVGAWLGENHGKTGLWSC